MSAQLPWGKKKTDEEIAAELDLRKKGDDEVGSELVVVEEEPQPQPKKSTLVVHKPRSTGLTHIQRNNDIVIHQGGRGGAIVQVRSKEVMIAGVKRRVDPYQLIRCIRRVTQNIGEYKMMEDIYSAIIIGALRKGRGDLVSILENEFSIHWQIEENTGASSFYM